MKDLSAYLPHVNASLNALATLLLITGLALIKSRRETAHKRVMLAAFAVSALFLASYLTYHFSIEGSKKFPSYPPDVVRTLYFAVLITHVILAATVPILAPVTIYLALADRRKWHIRMARVTFPIWIYVSVTGVVVYLMLYQLYPDQAR